MQTGKSTELPLTLASGEELRPLCTGWDYAPQAIAYVHEKTGLNKGMILADINSGTGKLTKHFLKAANTVYCIEQDRQCRQIAAERFWKNRNFIEMNGTAERTGIDSRSIDVIACGDGIRGCDAHGAIREFRRILKPDGWLVFLETLPLPAEGEQGSASSPEDDAYSPELMAFYYPGGIWEKKEFQARFLMEKEEAAAFLRRGEERLQEDAPDHPILPGKTILHIGRPGF